MTLARGTVVLVELDATRDHEQRDLRPCIAVSDPVVNRRRGIGHRLVDQKPAVARHTIAVLSEAQVWRLASKRQ